ncbi:MAG: hypothetical protein Tsb0017_04480 [Geothermobacteraceae bacterium]
MSGVTGAFGIAMVTGAAAHAAYPGDSVRRHVDNYTGLFNHPKTSPNGGGIIGRMGLAWQPFAAVQNQLFDPDTVTAGGQTLQNHAVRPG